MTRTSLKPSKIKANRHLNVKWVKLALIGLAGIGIWGLGNSYAQPAPKPATTPLPTPSPTQQEVLPEIEAKTYEVWVARRSRSGRVYLFNETGDSIPNVGTVLLLKENAKHVMAFRVLKQYGEKKQFAAKKVRIYPNRNQLEKDQAFLAVEKISDIYPEPSPPPLTKADDADLKELESAESTPSPEPSASPEAEAANEPPSEKAENAEKGDKSDSGKKNPKSFDSELDASTSPPPKNDADKAAIDESNNAEDENEGGDNPAGITVQEVQQTDPYNHWLTGEFGMFRGYNSSGGIAYNAGGGLRYALNVKRDLFIKKAHAQDSLSLEVGAFLYKILNFSPNINDGYTIMPLLATGRYNIIFSEEFLIFGYAGLEYNLLVAAANGTPQAEAYLSGLMPALGGGMMFRVGPNWHLRFDIGMDVVGLGLVLRF